MIDETVAEKIAQQLYIAIISLINTVNKSLQKNLVSGTFGAVWKT